MRTVILALREAAWTGPGRPAIDAASRPQAGASAWVAQLVEQRIENPRVAGSIPALGTITFQGSDFFHLCNYSGTNAFVSP